MQHYGKACATVCYAMYAVTDNGVTIIVANLLLSNIAKAFCFFCTDGISWPLAHTSL